MSIIQGTSKGSGAVYEIDQSIRFDKTTSSHLSKTYGSAGDRKTWTFSTWFKRGKIDGTRQSLFAATGTAYLQVGPDAASREMITIINEGSGTNLNWYTTQVFRDPSAWYHLVWQFDSTQATADDRTKLYINGVQVTDFTKAATPSLNLEGAINNAVEHKIGEIHIANYYFDGYQAEINFIDGTALDPTSFGETNDDGVWIPKAYDGSYGTNGFYITGETASDLGEDFSGNGNDFTSSGLATTDQMLDTPTNNFAVQNYGTQGVSNLTWSEGNLNILADSSAQWHTIPATIYPQSGKWGYQATIKSPTAFIMIGWMSEGDIEEGNVGGGKLPYSGSNSNTAFLYNTEAQKYVNNTQTFTGGLAGLATNDVVECLMDIDNGTISWKKNGSAYTSFTGLNTTDNPLTVPMVAVYGGSSYQVELDYGQGGYTPSDGDYKTICTANLATPSITDGSAYFQPTLYTGNSSTLEVNQSGNSTFQPDWLWVKSRSLGAGGNHVSYDAVRGVTKEMYPNLTNAEATTSALTSFDADGFTLQGTGVGTSDNRFNQSGETYVGWQWEANGAGSSNTDGSITSTVSANTTSGFSIVSYTGNQTSGATFGHGLGVAPKMVIVKERSPAGNNWKVGHDAMGWGKYIALDTAAAAVTSSTHWNNTAPSSTVVTLGNDTGINQNTATYVAYCFAEIPGYSSIGSYKGNSSTDGTFVYTGFRPSMILWKQSTGANPWGIRDTARDPFNVAKAVLRPSGTDAETTASSAYCDILSNGFKLRATDGFVNNSASTYIYMAFAENPFGGDSVAPATAR